MSRDVPVADRVIDVLLALQVEDVHRPPFIPDLGAQGIAILMLVDPVGFVEGGLLGTGVE